MQNSHKQGNMMVIAAIIGAVVLVGGLVLMTKGKSTTSETASTQQTQEAKPTTGQVAGAQSDVQEFEVEAGSFYFKPNEMRVKKGQKVKVTLKSVSMMHDFVVDELGIKAPVTKNGETSTFEFTADKTGTFEYYCSVGQHRKMGQVGKLIVE